MQKASCGVIACILFLTFKMSAATAKLPCRNFKCRQNAPKTNLYALSISQKVYSPEKPISDLSVKVYMTECATIDTPGPYWYKIEAISNNQLVGEFENPIPAWRFPTAVWLVRAGVAMCMDNSVIEFSSYEPNAISDLPRTYKWNSDAGDKGTICFRLTMLTDRCRVTEQCIKPEGNTTSATELENKDMENAIMPASTFENSITEGNTNLSEGFRLETIPPLTSALLRECAHNCPKNSTRKFCSSPCDGRIYSSRCEFRIHKCVLRKLGVDTQFMEVRPCNRSNTEECATVLASPLTDAQTGPCLKEREESSSYLWARCENNGDYKLTQCDECDECDELDKVRCWCSNPNTGSQRGKMEWCYECEDPKTYEPVWDCHAASQTRGT